MTKKTNYATDWSQVPLVVDPAYISVLLGIHPQTVFKLLRSGELKGYKFARQWRINKCDLMAFMGLPKEVPA